MADPVTRSDDASDLQTVANLLARAGLRLPADQIAALVPGFRADRAAMEKLVAALLPENETAHSFRAGSAARQSPTTPGTDA